MSPRWVPDPNIRRGRSVVWNLHAHLVFVTKYRRGALTGAILADSEQIMADVCARFGATLTEFGGEDDHVHLLVHYPPAVQLSHLVNSLKGVSSRLLRKQHGSHLDRYLWGGHLWSPSYFAGSAGGAPLNIVHDYILSQRSPHPGADSSRP